MAVKAPCQICVTRGLPMCGMDVAKPASFKVSGKFYCSRLKGHEGEHIACGLFEHDQYRWPQAKGGKA